MTFVAVIFFLSFILRLNLPITCLLLQVKQYISLAVPHFCKYSLSLPSSQTFFFRTCLKFKKKRVCLVMLYFLFIFFSYSYLSRLKFKKEEKGSPSYIPFSFHTAFNYFHYVSFLCCISSPTPNSSTPLLCT